MHGAALVAIVWTLAIVLAPHSTSTTSALLHRHPARQERGWATTVREDVVKDDASNYYDRPHGKAGPSGEGPRPLIDSVSSLHLALHIVQSGPLNHGPPS